LQLAAEEGKQIIVLVHEPAFDPDWSRKPDNCLDRDRATRDLFCV